MSETPSEDKIDYCNKNDNKCEDEGLGCINEFKCETSNIYPSYHYNGVYFTKMDWISAYKRRCKSQSNSNCAKPEGLTEAEASEEEYCNTMNLYCRIEKDKCVTRPENEIFCDKLLKDDDVSLTKDQVEYMYKLYQLGAIANLKSCLNTKKVDISQNRWVPEYFLQSKKFNEEYKLVNCSDFQIILDNLNEIITNNNEDNLIHALQKEDADITSNKGKPGAKSSNSDNRQRKIQDILNRNDVKNFKRESLFQTINNLLVEIPKLRDPFFTMLRQCNLIGKIRIQECEKRKRETGSYDDDTKSNCEKETLISSDLYNLHQPTQFEVAYIITRLFYKFSTTDLLVSNIEEQILFHWLFNSFTKDRTWSQFIQLDRVTENKEERTKNRLQSSINIYIKKLEINEYITTAKSSKMGEINIKKIENIFTILNQSKYLDIPNTAFEDFNLPQNYTLNGSNELESDYFSKLCLELDLITTKNISELSVNVGYTSKVLSLLESVPYSLLNVYRYVGSFWWQSKQYQYMFTVIVAMLKNATLTTLLIPYLGEYGNSYVLLVNFTHDVLCILQSFGNSGAFLLSQGYSGWGDDIYSFLTALSIANGVDMIVNPLFRGVDYIREQKKDAKKTITEKTIKPKLAPIFNKNTRNDGLSDISPETKSAKILSAIRKMFNFLIKAMDKFPETRAIQTILSKAFEVNNIVKPEQLAINLIYIVVLLGLTHWISESASCTQGTTTVENRFQDHIGSVSQYPIKIAKFALSCSSNSACTHSTSVSRAKEVLDQLHITNKSVIGLGRSFNELFQSLIGSITSIFKSNGQKLVTFDSVSDCFSGLIQMITNLATLLTEYIKNPNMTAWETYSYLMEQDNLAANWVYSPSKQMGSGPGSAWSVFEKYCLDNDLDPNSWDNVMHFRKLRGTFFFKVNYEGVSDLLWGIGNSLLAGVGTARSYVSSGGDNRRYTIKNRKQGKKRTINRKIHKNKSVKRKNKMRTKTTKYRKHNLLK